MAKPCVGVADMWLAVSSAPDATGICFSSSWPSSLRTNEIYALTNPDGLNLGRQTGIHEDEAGEFMIDGEWIVLRRMWISNHDVR